jgi:hypothetical protein
MIPQQPTIVPAVLDDLLGLLRADDALPEKVSVVDGPPLSTDTLAYDCLIVAHGTPTEPGVFSTLAPLPGMGHNAYRESVEVALVFSTFAGSTAMQARRDRAAEVLAAVKAVVDANQVTDTWDGLRMGGEMVWYPVQSDAGATLAVGFTIIAEAIV